jgi:hypothetical protein
MASIYEIEKMIETIYEQIKILCEIVGIEPTPMPNDNSEKVTMYAEISEPLEGSEPSA